LALASGLIKFDLTVAEHLSSKLLEWTAPRLDLSLKTFVLLGGVGDVDGCASVGDDLALWIVGDLNVTNVLAPAVSSDDEDLIAVRVIDNGRVLAFGILHVTEKGVTMTTHDQLKTLGSLSKILVMLVVDLISSMAP
jgi:hypothetical protein